MGNKVKKELTRLQKRNAAIRASWDKDKDRYKTNYLLERLADEYYLSAKTIYFIVARQGRYKNN